MTIQSNKISRALILATTLLSLSSCDLFRKEAHRTQAQLVGLANQAGAGDATEAIGKAYNENVAPAVAPVGDLANAAVKNAESVAALNSTITAVSEKADDIQRSAEQYSAQVSRNMPRSERGVVGTINGYQDRFTKWLLSFNPNFGRQRSDNKKK